MNTQEVIERVKNQESIVNSLEQDEKCIILMALKKQIPAEPIRKSWELPRCPSCGAALGEWLGDGYTKDWESKKVCDCGQKIKWHDDI